MLGFLKLGRSFPLSKLEIIYLPPNIHSLTHKTTTCRVQLQKKTKVLVAKISVVKVTANSAKSQALLRHSKRWSLLIYQILFVSFFLVCLCSLSLFLCFCRYLSFSSEWAFCCCCSRSCGGGAWRSYICRVSKKEQKNKRKTQKLGWL